MPFDDDAIARDLSQKYPDILTAADARRESDEVLVRQRGEVVRPGRDEDAAEVRERPVPLAADVMR